MAQADFLMPRLGLPGILSPEGVAIGSWLGPLGPLGQMT